MTKWQKGMHVFIKRSGFSSDEKSIDYRYKYKIRSCGKKQAILERVYSPEEMQTRRYAGNKGSAYYLTDPSTISDWISRHPDRPLPPYYNRNWSDYFSPAGDGDWDSEENYAWS